MPKHDPRYYKAIEYFNKHEFYDAHETWEDVWNAEQGEAKEFVQGLIQFATALHHFEGSNMKGTRILYLGGVELLSEFPDVYWELPVKKLLAEMLTCVEGLLPYKQADLPGRYHPEKEKFAIQIDPNKIPKIELIDAQPS